MSLWIEALCIHEWCLFTERAANVNRGAVHSLLTAWPDNRRPLTWERNQIDILMMASAEFICPWTEKQFTQDTAYDLDHILPIAVYPTMSFVIWCRLIQSSMLIKSEIGCQSAND